MKPIDVAAGIVVRDGTILITRRKAGSHLAGLWEFPGGKLEPGETWAAGLVRELREELGIEVEVGALQFETTHEYPTKAVHLRFYECRLVTGEPQPLDCDAVEWVAPDALTRYEFPEADRQLIEVLSRRSR